MVSKASEDLPEPETPVTTVSFSTGMVNETFFRLLTRAPRTMIASWLMSEIEPSAHCELSGVGANRQSYPESPRTRNGAGTPNVQGINFKFSTRGGQTGRPESGRRRRNVEDFG